MKILIRSNLHPHISSCPSIAYKNCPNTIQQLGMLQQIIGNIADNTQQKQKKKRLQRVKPQPTENKMQIQQQNLSPNRTIKTNRTEDTNNNINNSICYCQDIELAGQDRDREPGRDTDGRIIKVEFNCKKYCIDLAHLNAQCFELYFQGIFHGQATQQQKIMLKVVILNAICQQKNEFLQILDQAIEKYMEMKIHYYEKEIENKNQLLGLF